MAQSVKNPPAMQETCLSSIPGSGRSPGEGNSNPLQYCCLGNPMVRGAWWATVHGVQRVKHDLTTKPAPCVISNMEGTERKRNGQRETLRCRMGTVTASSNLTGKLENKNGLSDLSCLWLTSPQAQTGRGMFSGKEGTLQMRPLQEPKRSRLSANRIPSNCAKKAFSDGASE